MIFLSPLPSQVFLAGDSAGDAYKSIRDFGYDYEVPDCNHAVRHITFESDASSGLVTIAWVDGSNNEDQFRIDRSIDGVTWKYHATASANAGSYTDTRLDCRRVYHYRVRSENTYGNSPYCQAVKAVLQKVNDSMK
ncbi:MAG: fibronectin type III domain-containing protein [Ignavibacteria bacterium]|nr:fibronectin type III domain-containing protein [Ignavibacteria bacterium]